jgi:hypothetical protein
MSGLCLRQRLSAKIVFVGEHLRIQVRHRSRTSALRARHRVQEFSVPEFLAFRPKAVC